MVLPISHVNRYRRETPTVVYLIIAINVIVFLIELLLGEKFIAAYSTVPYEITNNVDLIRSVYVPGVGVIPQAPGPHPIYITILTSMFMHGGFLHIAGNMLYLWIFGNELEENFGHFRFLFFYLICGVAAAFAQIFMDPNSVIPSLGASGAIAGVLGAYIFMFPHERIRALLPLGFIWVPVVLPAVAVIGLWIVIQFFSQFATIIEHTTQTRGDSVAYMAHIGGFITGLLLSFLFKGKEHQKEYNHF